MAGIMAKGIIRRESNLDNHKKKLPPGQHEK
jgi:hypothetical protein